MDIISEQAKRERASYMREYRRMHPEKTREINKRYWEKRARKKEAELRETRSEDS